MNDTLKELWRVRSIRSWMGQQLHHTSWFASKESADIHVNWLKHKRIEVLSIAKYILVNEENK